MTLKLPHWVILILSAVLSAATWTLVQSSNGALPIPAVWLGALSQVAIIVKAILAITTDSPATAAKLARIGVRAVSALAMVFVFAGCGPATTSHVVQTIPPGVSLVDCVYTQVDACIANHIQWPQCTVDTAKACGADVASVVSIWAAKRASEAREGLAPAPNDAGIP